MRATILSMTVLTGCSGLHLYNSADEQLARKAQDSFKAADVTSFIDSERKTLALSEGRDRAVAKRNMQAQRDAALLYALENGTTVQKLIDFLNERLTDRGIPNSSGERRTLHDLEDMRHTALRARSFYAMEAMAKSLPYPSFPPSEKDKQAAAKISAACPAVTPWCVYADKSKEYSDALTKVAQYNTGDLGEINRQLKEGRELQKKISDDVQTARSNLDSVTAQYKTAAINPNAKLNDAKTKVEAALKQFDDIAAKYEDTAKNLNLNDVLALSHVEKAKKVRAEIGQFLAAYAQDSTTSDSSKQTSLDAAGRTATILVKAQSDIEDASIHAKLVPLIFEQERLRLDIEYGQRAVTRLDQRLTLLERQRAELIREGNSLIDSVNSIQKGCADINCKPATDSTLSLLGNNNSSGSALHALFVLSDSITINKRKRREAEVELVRLDQEQALDASDYALKTWKAMIASPLEELVAYHASGLKSQDIANLIHAAGLAGIAVGVNR